MSYFASGNKFMYFDYLSEKPIYVDTANEAILGEKESHKKYEEWVHENYHKMRTYQKLPFEKVLEEKGYVPIGEHKEFSTIDNCIRRWNHPELGYAVFFLWKDEKANHPQIGLTLQGHEDIMVLPTKREKIEKYFTH